MADSKNTLSHERAISLLPISFRPVRVLTNIPKVYCSGKGNFIIRQSKVYDSNELWQSIRKEQLIDNNISYVCVIAGFLGILLIPSKYLLDYFEKYDVTTVKDGRYNIRIKIDGAKFLLGESGRPKLDITEFLIPEI